MHITTVLSPKYEAMIGERGGKDWGLNEADGRQHRRRAQEAGGHRPARQHHRCLHHRQRRRDDDLSRRGCHAVPWAERRGLGRRLPRSAGRPLAGPHKPGTVKNQLFAALDWLPTLVDIAGGPKGDGLRNQIEAGQYSGIVKTTLDGFNQRAYLEGTSEKSARDHFFYYSGSTPSAVRYKNWKMYYTMSQPGGAAYILDPVSYHFTLVQNIKRDPFEQMATPQDNKSEMGWGGSIGSPSTA